ncbi:MAG: monofunctional biosynthetic peptidoglycan transglycosylase [Proteobacteria bacterium]|nr:monofunctional biosynthetic peptidoglycan transglycosylase [Pseudomonadota bacterium]
MDERESEPRLGEHAEGRAFDGPWTHPRTAPRRTAPLDAATARTEPAEPIGPLPKPRSKGAPLGRSRWLKLVLLLALLSLALPAAAIVVFRFVTPTETPVMMIRRAAGMPVRQVWVPFDLVSPRLVRAVVSSEDGHFCTHHGIDLGELRSAISNARSGALRGASTITMQVVKNLFLWPGRSYIRKALELPLAVVLDATWPKTRIIETYLNIAEWGPGIYGIEAASRRAFGKPASELTEGEAVRLAVVLPAPAIRDPRYPRSHEQRVAQVVAGRVRQGVNVSCLYRRRAANVE